MSKSNAFTIKGLPAFTPASSIDSISADVIHRTLLTIQKRLDALFLNVDNLKQLIVDEVKWPTDDDDVMEEDLSESDTEVLDVSDDELAADDLFAVAAKRQKCDD